MSIELKLQAILETKAALQAALNLPNSVPFSQYAGRINWKDETPPADLMFADYTKDRYSVSGVPVGFSDVNEFTRLTAATNFVDGKLVEYAVGQPRIETGKGLLIESQATNAVLDNTFTSATVSQPTKVSLSDVEDSSIPNAKLLTSKVAWTRGGGALTNLQSQGDYPLGASTLIPQDGFHFSYIVKNSGGARYASLHYSDITGYGAIIDFVEEVYVGDTSGSMRNLGGGWWELRRWHTPITGVANKQFRVSFGNAIDGINLVTEIGDNVFVAYPSAYDAKDIDLSIIPTYGTAVTRSPDLLRLTIPAGKTLTLDADAGVSFVMENATTALITATEPGYIRSARVN